MPEHVEAFHDRPGTHSAPGSTDPVESGGKTAGEGKEEVAENAATAA